MQEKGMQKVRTNMPSDLLWYFCWFRVHFWRLFGTLWAHFGVLLAQIGSLLVPCTPIWVILHPRVFVLVRCGRNKPFKAVFCKKIHLHWPGIKFLANFSHANYLPWARGRNYCRRQPRFAPGPCAAHRRGVLASGVSACFLPACTLSPQLVWFLQYSFFSRRIPSWIPPFPSLIGRVLVTFWRPFGWKWVVVFSSCFFGEFLDDVWRVFD